MALKQCSTCQQWKKLSCFYKRSDSKDGYRAECSSCQCKRQNRWMKEHRPDLLRANWHNQWLKRKTRAAETRSPRKSPMTKQECSRRYYEKHKAQALVATCKWRTEHLEHVRKLERERYARNPQKDIARVHRRRLRIERNGGDYTPEEWNALCEKYGGRCLACNSQRKLTVDHIMPLSMGGKNSVDNIQPLCKNCNSAKGIRFIDYRQTWAG